VFRDAYKRDLIFNILPSIRTGNTIKPGIVEIRIKNPDQDSHEVAYLSGLALSQIAAYDTVNKLWISGMKDTSLKIVPSCTNPNTFHQVNIFSQGFTYVSLDLDSIREFQSLAFACIPWIYGFHFLKPANAHLPFERMLHVSHQFKRNDKRRYFAVNINPCRHRNGLIEFGSIYFRFINSDDFIGVSLSLLQISTLCSHNFQNGGVLYLCSDFLSNETSCTIQYDAVNQKYFIFAHGGELKLCFRLNVFEFLHLRNLLKAALPFLSGFDYALNL